MGAVPRVRLNAHKFQKAPQKTHEARKCIFMIFTRIKPGYKTVYKRPAALAVSGTMSFHAKFSRKGRRTGFKDVFSERKVIVFYVKI